MGAEKALVLDQSIEPWAAPLAFCHTDFGNAFAPRVGLTFNAAPFTAKVLYGRAFRIPLPWQAYSVFTSPFSASPNPEPLRPETADTIEVEAGYKVSDNMRARLNGFYIHVDDPIVYNGGLNLYNNSGQMNSAGAEGELQVRYPGYGGFVNFSYHRPVGDTSGFFLSEDEGAFLGHPPIKINAAGYLTFDKFQFGPSLTFLSERHGQTIEYANIRYDATMPNVDAPFDSRTYPVRVLVNANLLARDIVPDVDVSLAAHNIFDTRYVLIQPYYGGHANMPANDRQVTLSLVWHTL